jgi:wobble nucleotide-excising tRNase
MLKDFEPTPKAMTERGRRKELTDLVVEIQSRLSREGGYVEKELSVANKRKSHGLVYNKIPTIKEFISRYDNLRVKCRELERENAAMATEIDRLKEYMEDTTMTGVQEIPRM